MNLPEVYKVVFVVDRRDLDYQTTKEFNSFSEGSVDGTDNTHALVKQFSDDTKLIVTTIQKLNNAISNARYLGKMENLKNKHMVFIFDECHRDQFGETHNRIKKFFTSTQIFGFTGTPIFADNAIGKRTTADLFGECLHKYVITDAIRDQNVLKFAIEYVGRYKKKENSKNNLDIEVEDIDTKELMESDYRLEKIAEYIIANHDRKTHSREFTAIFAVSSIDMLIKYYDIFKAKKDAGEHNLKVATIFTYGVNEDDKNANGDIADELAVIEDSAKLNASNPLSRDKLEQYIQEYNKTYGTKFTTRDSDSFYNYYRDIAIRVKKREIDILLVVNMFLTGFDSKPLNTLYVDKNLRYHGLIQSFSRTNRILNDQKSHGNIVCFRNLKHATDEAITLYSNKDAQEVVFMKPYEDYADFFNNLLKELRKIAPTVDDVDSLPSEIEWMQFVKAFRELIRAKNILVTFADFSFDDLDITEQEFEDFKSKYLDIYDRVKNENAKEIVSILEDVDFELELIHRDEINVTYILSLLAKLKADSNPDVQTKIKKSISDLLSSQPQLRSKKELIEKFIEENLPQIDSSETITDEFDEFWDVQKQKAFNKMCEELNLDTKKTQKIIGDYMFTENKPLGDDIVDAIQIKPTILQRIPVIEKARKAIMVFIETFIEGI